MRLECAIRFTYVAKRIGLLIFGSVPPHTSHLKEMHGGGVGCVYSLLFTRVDDPEYLKMDFWCWSHR